MNVANAVVVAVIATLAACDRASSPRQPAPDAPPKLRDRPAALTRVTLKALGVT